MQKNITLSLLCSLLCFTGIVAQNDVQKKLQRQLIMAKDGSTITIEAGSFHFLSSLSLEGKKNIVIEGAGIEKTILNFKGQTEGAEGIRVSNCENITIKNLCVEDTKGDAIKTMNVKNITFEAVKTAWYDKGNPKNGSYGLYPVQCQGVMIDKCVAIGASDAGIYVGQSKDIVVKNCVAYENVAGIEIENSLNAAVFDNEAYNNTGGVLVFDLPDLVQKKGGFVKVYRNNIHDNNLKNFAPKGNIVGTVPQGTGVLILATNHVEVFDNQIIRNNSVGAGIISYFMTEKPINDNEYYPYPSDINIHDNTFQRDNVRFQGKGRFGLLFKFKLRLGKKVPHILYDGIIDPKQPDSKICIANNKEETYINLDAEHGFKNRTRDMAKVRCEK
jgi:parallel beta-helix repeat protein